MYARENKRFGLGQGQEAWTGVTLADIIPFSSKVIDFGEEAT